MKYKRIVILTSLLAPAVFAGGASVPAIIPAPQRMELREGVFQLGPDTRVRVDAASRQTGKFLAERLRQSTGYRIRVDRKAVEGAAIPGSIVLTTNQANANLGAEGYELAVAPDAVVIRAPTEAGVFYGAQTLLQLLPPEIFSPQAAGKADWKIPCVQIEDQPRFKWRGLMLDVSRHFFTKAEVERLLDEMALHKMNTFHWHLADDQGWRIEIKKYPKLTQLGAWRTRSGFGMEAKASTAYDKKGRYGGFYTQDDIRAVVKYAAARHIRIVPEIEMPGHSSAALSAYPQFSCGGGPFEPPLIGGVFNGIYDPAKEETFGFLEDVLTEVFQLFPGEYVHIGGDEVPKEDWKKSPDCQALMKREGLKNEEELQSWFIRRIAKFVQAHGRTLVGWSEILQGGLAQDAVVMDWIGGGAEAAGSGHDAVMTPTGYCYFDSYQSTNHATEPFAIGGYTPLEKVYEFEPAPANLAAQFQPRILGAQGNVWTEYIPNFRQAEYMIFPRACALAEVGWSPREARNWDDFTRRLAVHEERLAQLDVNYRHDGGLKSVQAQMVEPPAPFGPTPSRRQLAWQQMELVGFVHFTVNTFTDKEWGEGNEPETIFNPTAFDAGQIVRAAHDAGMKELILTAKHHDGFCLWPSKFTEHSVKNSPWRDGQGDVVKEISEACRRQGLRFGVYLSPWDRNRADYGTAEYIAHYRDQLRELLSNYGPISEVWFDGANGGTGYYGGANERRVIDRKTYYDWPKTWQLVRELQPGACIFSDGGPDIRWVGNESGVAGETCWATLNAAEYAPGDADERRLNRGDRPGTDWVPAECDVSIRPGWFYHKNEDDKVKTPGQLLDLYFKSVGRGATLLLNIPPDRRGQIPEADVKSLDGFRRLLDATFARDLARDARVTASNVRGQDSHFAPEKVLDDRRDTYWATDDAVTNAELVLEFKQPVTFNLVRLREYLPLGQRVEEFALDQWKDGQWLEFAKGTSIGNCRLVRTEPVTTRQVRLRIVKCPVCPAIAELGLFSYHP
ncbi:MAG: family 20 glycosylhydrolase [Verrucomicrobiota bacterium]